MKKRVLSILLTLCMALTALPLSGVPALAATSGDFESRGLSETDKTCEITDYTGSAAELEIPATLDGYTVTSIGMGAIDSCSSLTNIDIPDSVTSIGNGAFGFCPLLASIDVAAENPSYSSQDGVLFTKDKTALMKYPAAKPDTAYSIPDTVTSIGGSAFAFCEALTNIDIPESVTSIEESAFQGCSSLTSIDIPNNVTYLADFSFAECASLRSISIPDTVTSIGFRAFYKCSALTAITIPNSVTRIGEWAFAYCDVLKDVTINNGVTNIGRYAFRVCTSLTSIHIPNCVTSIEEGTFERCTSLASITIPESVTSIDEQAFRSCDNLTIYGVAGSYAETYAEQNGIPFVGVPPTLAKDRSQVRFTAENGDIADAFDYRLISSIPDMVWDLYFASAGGTTITAVGFVAANESDRAALADAQAAVESGTALPAGWKTAGTDYIQKADDDADAYFGCMIKGIQHSEQTEDIVCSAYIAYTTAAGQTAYVWYDAPVVALVATNYDAAADAWRAANA